MQIIKHFFHYLGVHMIMINGSHHRAICTFILQNIAFHMFHNNITSSGFPSRLGFIYIRRSVKIKCYGYTC